ncbi:MAG: GntR family transcriptional regulator [Rubellimicrobium sp.]|nr:GntR family transcriptional regulator [Rubellimicrobium sp.]
MFWQKETRMETGRTDNGDNGDGSDEGDLAAALKEYLRAAHDPRPLYRKVADGIEAVMAERNLALSTHLPGERILAERLGIARATLRRALAELAGAGLLVQRHGARSTLAPRMEKALATLTGFSAELRARGLRPGTRWIARAIVTPSAEEIRALSLAPGAAVLRLERVRLADGAPIALERAVVPAAVLPSGDAVGASLYDALAAHGAAPVQGEQRIRAGVMSRAEAQLLDCRAGDPILIVERRCTGADGRPVEFTETRYRGDSYDFVTGLRASPVPE